MWLRVLGSAAGGGFPQWNCSCPTCSAARSGARPCRARTQSSVAVSGDREHWYLINASPDVLAQIEAFPALHPRAGRATPIDGVLLTDAELDHTIGLLMLREGRGVDLHATAAMHETLCEGTALLPTLRAYCPARWHEVVPGAAVRLAGGLSYRAFDVPTTKRARFGPGRGAAQDNGRVVGYRITDEGSGRALVYLPGVQELTAGVREQLAGCDHLLIDGTCWQDDELIRLGLAGKTSREMGHLPIDGPDGSLAQLAALPIAHKIYVHLNNTNPILIDDSPERQIVEKNGMRVAEDGLEIRI